MKKEKYITPLRAIVTYALSIPVAIVSGVGLFSLLALIFMLTGN